MASIITSNSDYALHRLYSRGTAQELNYSVIFTMLVIYFIGLSV